MCGTVEEVLEDTIKTGQIMEQFQGIADNIVNQSITEQTGLISPTSIRDNLDQGSISETLASVDSTLVSSSVPSVSTNTTGGIINLNYDPEIPTIPKVPVCYAEDLAAKIITANRKMIDTANDNIVRSMNYFMDDMQKMLTSTGATEDSGEAISGEVMGYTDAEVLDQTIGGTNYLTATSVPTGIFGNVNPGITTSKGEGCIVNIKVSSGGLSGYGAVDGAQNYEWISQGTNYVNGNHGGVICDTSGIGTGMQINMTVTAGAIQTVRVHTIGTGYKVGDEIYPHMQGGTGSIAGNGGFKLTMVAGPIDPGGIDIIKRGVDYQGGDVLFVNQNNYGVVSTDGTFTVTSTSTKPKKKLKGTGQSLDDILGKIGGIGGNITQALKFKNVAANVFPFELPPNEAVSDMYKMGTGGSSKPDSQLPSIENIAGKVKDVGKEAFGGVPFIEPSLGEPELIYDDAKNVINSSSPS